MNPSSQHIMPLISILQIKCFLHFKLEASSILMAKPKFLILVSFIFFLSFFHGESLSEPWQNIEEDNEVIVVQSRHDSRRRCDFSVGKWVYDQTYPLYDSNCPYLSTAVTCQKNGRPDSDYEKWRWKPQGCSIPR